jgi:hypothetical protein
MARRVLAGNRHLLAGESIDSTGLMTDTERLAGKEKAPMLVAIDNSAGLIAVGRHH